MPDTPDEKPQITGMTGASPGGDRPIDRSDWLPGDPWDAPGAGRGEAVEITGGAAPPVIAGGNSWITGGAPPVKFDGGARGAGGRFAPGVSGNPAARFCPGQSGNPAGRPRGSGKFRAGTRAAAALLDAHAELIAQKAIELALGGDPVAVRFCLGRVLGVRRGQPVELALPAVAAPGDLAAAVGAITAAVAAGGITPDEALALSQMLDGFPRIFAAGQQAADPYAGTRRRMRGRSAARARLAWPRTRPSNNRGRRRAPRERGRRNPRLESAGGGLPSPPP